MGTITLPNLRTTADVTMNTRLKDGGVYIDWTGLTDIKAWLYSDAQKAIAGRCDVTVNQTDGTKLACEYSASKPQYLGVNRLIVQAKYMGETKTYDKPAFTFVRWTADQDGEQITIEDPEVTVEIDVEDVSSSILQEAVNAAFSAADRANDVADSLAGVEADVEAAEALRVAAEESRVEAEDDRAAAETARETAEAARETAEAAREAQASADHIQAGEDHTQAQADHAVMAGYDTRLTNAETEVSQLQQELIEENPVSYEFNVVNYSLDNSGIKTSQGGYKMTDFLPIAGVSRIAVTGYVASTRAILAYYSSASESGFLGILDKHYTVSENVLAADFPANAAYIRCSSRASDGPTLTLVFTKRLKNTVESLVTKVDTPDAYEGVSKELTIKDGSLGNTYSSVFVRTLPVLLHGSRYVQIEVNRANRAGCHYAFGFALTSSYSDIGSDAQYSQWTGGLYKQDVKSYTTAFYFDIVDYPSAVGIAFTIGEFDANGVQQTLRSTDFTVKTYVAESQFIEKVHTDLSSSGKGVVERNYERIIPLSQMCRYRYRSEQPQKDIQLCICTDSHDDQTAFNNSVKVTNGFDTIDALVHCGDIVSGYYELPNITAFKNGFAELDKPGYVVVGNHDVGNAFYVGLCCDHTQAYNAFIKPMVDAGFLATGEYSANLPYWYHDDATYKVRFIGLYEFDDALDLYDSQYWETVTYDSTKPQLARSTSYQVGDVVNCGEYTAYSFRCKSAVTTPSSYYTDVDKFPRYIVRRGNRVIRKTQADWYLDKLATTPAGYGVIVITHNPFADDAETIVAKFSQTSGRLGSADSQNDMQTDLIGGALDAFSKGLAYSENIVMKGNATYLNTQGGGTYAYSVTKDFSAKNTGAFVLGLLGGHTHRDAIWKKGDLYQVSPLCASTSIGNASGSDIRRSEEDSIIKDSLTVVSFASGRIGLAKIGVNMTDEGKSRDYEVISTN